MWCRTGLENGKQVVIKRTGVVGHKSLSTKRLVVESLSDIETSKFKALLTYHFLIAFVAFNRHATKQWTLSKQEQTENSTRSLKS